jgi:hypothetical protein
MNPDTVRLRSCSTFAIPRAARRHCTVRCRVPVGGGAILRGARRRTRSDTQRRPHGIRWHPELEADLTIVAKLPLRLLGLLLLVIALGVATCQALFHSLPPV